MAENLLSTGNNKAQIYQSVLPQIKSLVSGEDNLSANLANTAAVLKTAFNFLWVGFYLVDGDELVLAPFQGPIACTRIKKGRGVCGAAWQTGEPQLVPDVDAFPGHIACSSLSRSEMVIPLYREQEIYGVLYIDSDQLNTFDEIDLQYLSEIFTYL